MTRRRALLLTLALAPAPARAGTGGVVASFSVLADIARRLTGGRVGVASLVPPDADAHAWQPSAGDLRLLAGAAVLIENGFGLEGWMSRLGAASGFNGTRVVASAGVTPRTMRDGAATSIDPHAWQNPRNGALYARNIARALAAADPLGSAAWRDDADRYFAAIAQTDAWIADQIAPIPAASRRIVTTHDAFGYYGDRYGIAFLAAEGLAAGAEPSAKAIAALVRQIRRENIRMVFLENMTDPRLARMLARESGAALGGPLYSDALSGPNGEAPDYLTMLRYNTGLFVRAMRRE